MQLRKHRLPPPSFNVCAVSRRDHCLAILVVAYWSRLPRRFVWFCTNEGMLPLNWSNWNNMTPTPHWGGVCDVVHGCNECKWLLSRLPGSSINLSGRFQVYGFNHAFSWSIWKSLTSWSTYVYAVINYCCWLVPIAAYSLFLIMIHYECDIICNFHRIIKPT